MVSALVITLSFPSFSVFIFDVKYWHNPALVYYFWPQVVFKADLIEVQYLLFKPCLCLHYLAL